SAAGAVVERFVYDPYGAVTVLDASWAVRAGGSAYGWVYGQQGLRYDGISGLYHARRRDFSPTLGRWAQEDPLSFVAGGGNPYRFEGNGPAGSLDPSGLWGWNSLTGFAPTLATGIGIAAVAALTLPALPAMAAAAAIGFGIGWASWEVGRKTYEATSEHDWA